jgi:creatinine amidohydrolase
MAVELAVELSEAVETDPVGKEEHMKPELSVDVQMQLMRPGQVEAAARAFPVVYVPFGCVEWHGRHLPLGNDALKAHAILVKCAEQFGGVVYPPIYFHDGFGMDMLVPVYTELFGRLKAMGFRVIMGASGHNVQGQLDMINQALEPVTADGAAVGVGLWEMSLSRCDESDSDHAAKWETSNMMFFYPDRVNMAELPDGPMNLDMKPPSGIGGIDPREHASAEVGRRNVELCVQAIGRKAQDLLASLPEAKRGFPLEALAPGHWWMV